MQKITLQPGEAVEINGAIIGMEIVDKLLSLQQGIDSPGNKSREQNIGITEQKGSYRRLIMFMADQAYCFDDKEGALEWMGSISVMMNDWDSFRIPGTGLL